MGQSGGGGSFIFNKFCRQHSPGTGDSQPLPYGALTLVEGLTSGALEAVIGVGRMDLADYNPHLQCDLDRIDCILTVCLHL